MQKKKHMEKRQNEFVAMQYGGDGDEGGGNDRACWTHSLAIRLTVARKIKFIFSHDLWMCVFVFAVVADIP